MHYDVTLIVGLPGSGKTSLANSMKNENTFIIDDPNRDRDIWMKAMNSGKSEFIVCDPIMILTDKNKIIEFLHRKMGDDISITWIYFENDPINAWNNHLIRNRKEYRDINKQFFDHMSKKYLIPDDAVSIPVYKQIDFEVKSEPSLNNVSIGLDI